MSTTDLVTSRERWTISASKFYGWLTGLAFSLFAGLLCSVPSGVPFGLIGVTLGIFLTVSFTVAVSASTVAPQKTLPLMALGLALIVLGRAVAPIEEVITSIQLEQTQVRRLTLLQVVGIPLMLLGMHIVQLVTPWLRRAEPMSYFRSALALVLIQGGSIALLIGAALTSQNPSWQSQPYYLWLAVPLAFGMGVGLRRHWREFSWIAAVMLLTGIVLPLTWALLRR